jgi:hypothetical protein
MAIELANQRPNCIGIAVAVTVVAGNIDSAKLTLW